MEKEQNGKRKLILDKPVFIAGAVIVFIPIAILMFMGEAGADLMGNINGWLKSQLGIVYLLMGVVGVGFCVVIALSRYGKLRMGGPDARPEYKFFKWAAMMFSMGVAASVFWAGSSEWVYYISNPPLGIEPFSERALDLAPALTLFHWGPTLWAIYTSAAIVVGYVYHIRNIPSLKLSCAVSLAYEHKAAANTLNRVVDVFIIVGLVLSAACSLGLGTPYVAAAISVITGFPDGVALRLIVMFVVIGVYAISSAAGLKKGMAVISDANVKIAIAITVFLIIVGPTRLIIQSAMTSTGMIFSEFITWSTWMEPNTTTSTFHSDWTAFYWAWAAAAGLVSGAFIARISRGYTLRQMIWGCLGFCTAGNALIVLSFSNFGIDLYRTGKFDSVELLQDGAFSSMAVMQGFMDNLPLAPVFLGVLSISCIIFMATTFDAFSFSLAAFTTKEILPDEEPAKWNKLFWAMMIGAIPLFVILANGDLSTIQSTAIISGTFSMFLLAVMMLGFIKTVRKTDHVFILRHLKSQSEADAKRFKEEFGVDDVDNTTR